MSVIDKRASPRFAGNLAETKVEKRLRLLTISASAAFCSMVVIGCTTDPDPRGERVAVNGTVLLDGNPVQQAQILFISDRGSGKVRAVGQVEAGTFVLDQSHGPLPGSNRVEIRPLTMELEAFEAKQKSDLQKQVSPLLVEIPARFNSKSELTADVSTDSVKNVFEFDLTSK